MNTKVCAVCKIEKQKSEYYKKGSTVQYRCKECVRKHIVMDKMDTCPNCNGKKRKESSLCAYCSRHIQIELYPEELIQEVQRLYSSGLSTWKVAKVLGTYQMRIRRILSRSGIKTRVNNFCIGQHKEESPRWTGYKDITGKYFGAMQKSARVRNLDFLITKEFLWDLIESQHHKCALSGLPIMLPLSDDDYTFGNYTASLDRIDSTKGYTENNVQWVHKWVNRIKQNMIEEEFLYLCQLISNKCKDRIQPIELSPQVQSKRRSRDVSH